jgi:hypothetical protein
MSGYATTQPNDRRFIRGTARSSIVSELTTTRPEPRFQLDCPRCGRRSRLRGFSFSFHTQCCGRLVIAGAFSRNHVTVFLPGFSQAFRS